MPGAFLCSHQDPGSDLPRYHSLHRHAQLDPPVAARSRLVAIGVAARVEHEIATRVSMTVDVEGADIIGAGRMSDESECGWRYGGGALGFALERAVERAPVGLSGRIQHIMGTYREREGHVICVSFSCDTRVSNARYTLPHVALDSIPWHSRIASHRGAWRVQSRRDS